MANYSTFNQSISTGRDTMKPLAFSSCVLVVCRNSSLTLWAADPGFFGNLNAIPIRAVPGDQSSLANGRTKTPRNGPNSAN